jgi:hypothetical protein
MKEVTKENRRLQQFAKKFIIRKVKTQEQKKRKDSKKPNKIGLPDNLGPDQHPDE